MATVDSSRSVPAAELPSRSIVARLSVAVVAVAYVGYLALLVTCDLRRVAPLGFIPLFEPGHVVVGQLQADSIAALDYLVQQVSDAVSGKDLAGQRRSQRRARPLQARSTVLLLMIPDAFRSTHFHSPHRFDGHMGQRTMNSSHTTTGAAIVMMAP